MDEKPRPWALPHSSLGHAGSTWGSRCLRVPRSPRGTTRIPEQACLRLRPHGLIVLSRSPAAPTLVGSANRGPGRSAERPRPGAGDPGARRRPEQGRGARAGTRGHPPGSAAEGGLGRRGIEWLARRAACPVPARPSKPPFFSLALGGGPREIREGAQPAVPTGRSRRTLPPTPPPPGETHKERPGGKRTPPVWAGLREGPAHSAAPALKGPPGSSRALRRPDRGAGRALRAAGAHALTARWRYGRRPSGAGAALVRVSAPAGSQLARVACAGPQRGAFRRSPEAGPARSALQPVSGFLIRSFRASWAKCCPRGQNCGRARAHERRCGRAFAFVSPALPCRWAARAGGHFASAPQDLETCPSCTRARTAFWADNRRFSQWHLWF